MDQFTIENIKLWLAIVAVVLSTISLVGMFAAYRSVRLNLCNQIYNRWQGLLLAQSGDTEKFLSSEEFDENADRNKGHFIAVAYFNLYEEAFFYQKRVYPFTPQNTQNVLGVDRAFHGKSIRAQIYQILMDVSTSKLLKRLPVVR